MGRSNFGISKFGSWNFDVLSAGEVDSLVFFLADVADALVFFVALSAAFSADFTLADGFAEVAVAATFFFLGVVLSLMMRPCSRESAARS